jgi:methylthioribose-1-phosphate isomerase
MPFPSTWRRRGSTFDLAISDGSAIPIEQRSTRRSAGFGTLTAPEQVPCYCPAFDVTLAELIRGIIHGSSVIEPVDTDQIREFFRK